MVRCSRFRSAFLGQGCPRFRSAFTAHGRLRGRRAVQQAPSLHQTQFRLRHTVARGRVCSCAMLSPSQSQLTVLDYLRILKRRRWWLVASVVLVTLAALGFSMSESTAYTATGDVVVQAVPSAASLASQIPPTLGVNDVATQQQVAGSAQVRQAVSRHFGKVPLATVGVVSGTNILSIATTDASPRRAALLANAYANAFVSYRNAQVIRSLNVAADELQARVTSLTTLVATLEMQLRAQPPGSPTSPTAQALQAQLLATLNDQGVVQGQLQQLKVSAASASGAKVITPAVTPTTPSSPKTARNVAIGLVAGLLLGLAACVMVDNLDDRIRSKSALQATLPDVPILGLIPSFEEGNSRGRPFVASVTSPDSPAAEAYRSLRTALQFVLMDKSVKTILVSSATAQEGKTSATANVGVALARAGQQVLVVSADLRAPRLGYVLGCDESVGLSSIALGECDLKEAVRPVEDIPDLWFLGTGPRSPAPAEFLSSRAVAEIIAGAADRFDVILVDCTPLLPVADALGASRFADGVMLMVRSDVTRRRDLRRTAELLSTADTPICGVVFNDVRPSELGGYGYSYYGQTRGHRRGRDQHQQTRSRLHRRVSARRPAAPPGSSVA